MCTASQTLTVNRKAGITVVVSLIGTLNKDIRPRVENKDEMIMSIGKRIPDIRPKRIKRKNATVIKDNTVINRMSLKVARLKASVITGPPETFILKLLSLY